MPKETLSSISRKYGVSLQAILKANSLDESDIIKTGQILIIPLEFFKTTYEVKSGDTLSSISRNYGIPFQEILEVNNIKAEEHIKVGQILVIPTGFTVKGVTHKVKSGETIYSIAHDYGVSVLSLCNANTIENPNNLKTGRLLVIPPKDNILEDVNILGESAIIGETVVSLKAKPSRNSEVVTQTILGDTVSIKEVSGNWYFVRISDGYFGWVEDSVLVFPGEEFKSSQKVIVSALMANIVCEPKESSHYRGKAVMGTTLPLLRREGQWVEVLLPRGQKGWLMEGQVLFEPRSPQKSSEIVKTAEMYLSVPYLWGGTTALGVDCSGFVFTVYKINGYKIPRDAESQFDYCEPREDKDLQPGDMVFFTTYLKGPSHVGIYLGYDKFIHASSSKGVTISSLNNEYYKSRYLGGGRIKELSCEK